MSGIFVRWFGLGCAAPGLLTVWLPDALLESWAGPLYLLWLFASGNAAWAALEALRAANERANGGGGVQSLGSKGSSGRSPRGTLQEEQGSGDDRLGGVGRGGWWALVAGTGIIAIAGGLLGVGTALDGRSSSLGLSLGVTCLGGVCLGALWALGWNVERQRRREG